MNIKLKNIIVNKKFIFKKGFTLIELLIIISILSILSIIVVLVINPSELLKKARDSQRLNDLNTLNKAIIYYLNFNNNLNLGLCSDNEIRFTAAPAKIIREKNKRIPPPFCLFCGSTRYFTNFSEVDGFKYRYYKVVKSTDINGTGWVSINFKDNSDIFMLKSLPIDPINDSSHYYVYHCDNDKKYYEINTRFESKEYQKYHKQDGGKNDNFYEIGNKDGLNL